MKIYLAFALGLVVLIPACCSAPTATPAPTVDVAAIQTQAALSVHATLTASAPKVTNTPANTPTSVATSTAVPTNTALPSATIQPTETPAIPPRGKYNDANYPVLEQYDRIKDLTTVKWGFNESEAQDYPGAPGVIYSYSGQKPQKPTSVDFTFLSGSSSWRYLDCYDMALLLDDNIRLQPKTTHYGQVGSGSVAEEVAATLSVNVFLQIVNAHKVEGTVCSDAFTLSAEQMEGLRDAASRMQP